VLLTDTHAAIIHQHHFFFFWELGYVQLTAVWPVRVLPWHGPKSSVAHSSADACSVLRSSTTDVRHSQKGPCVFHQPRHRDLAQSTEAGVVSGSVGVATEPAAMPISVLYMHAEEVVCEMA